MEPDQDVSAWRGQFGQARIVGRQRAIAVHLPQRITVQRQLGKDDQVSALADGRADVVSRLFKVGRNIPERNVGLRQRYPHHPTCTSYREGLFT